MDLDYTVVMVPLSFVLMVHGVLFSPTRVGSASGRPRCEIADELFDQAKARGAVSTWAGGLWAGTRGSDRRRRGSGAVRDHQHRGSLGASSLDGDEDGSGDQELDGMEAEAAEGRRLLEEAVEFYTLATTSSDDTGARRALFSLGWLHQARRV